MRWRLLQPGKETLRLYLNFIMPEEKAKEAKPNKAHHALADLQKNFNVTIITQNIDDLHERAGSKNVIHLHGEIFKMRSVNDETKTYPIFDEIQHGQKADDGGQLRPHIVWFEEPVPMIEEASRIVRTATIFLIVGTSLVVYPAAGLIHYAPYEIPKFIIDKNIPATNIPNLTAIEKSASEGMEIFKKLIINSQIL